MNAEPNEPRDQPHNDADYAMLVRDVRYLKAAVATIAEQIARRDSASSPSQVAGDGQDDEERAILAYLTDGIPPSEREEARAALDAFASLVHDVSVENGLTESELADRFDAARRTASLPR